MEKGTRVIKIGTDICVYPSEKEIENYALEIAKKAALDYLQENKLDKEYCLNQERRQYFSNLRISNINIRFPLIFNSTREKEEKDKRDIMLKKASEIKLDEFLVSFRDSLSNNNKGMASRFIRIFVHGAPSCRYDSLEDFIKFTRRDLSRFRSIGTKGLDLFEKFLNEKGFELDE
jgi:hypothetical protein